MIKYEENKNPNCHISSQPMKLEFKNGYELAAMEGNKEIERLNKKINILIGWLAQLSSTECPDNNFRGCCQYGSCVDCWSAYADEKVRGGE